MKRAVIIFLITGGLVKSSDSQNLSFEKPVKLPAQINSNAEETAVMPSPDGKGIYFSRIMYSGNSGGESGGQDIWLSLKQDDETWSEASNQFPTLNYEGDNAVVGFSYTADTVYLLNKYKSKNTTEMGVSFSIKENELWSKPQAIQVPGLLSNSGFYGFYMHPNGKVLLISMDGMGSLGNEDLYVSIEEDGKWSDPKHLGKAINTAGFEMSPFLSKDMKYLFFAGDGHGGLGNADIFVSEKIDSSWDNWSEPANLGEVINSPGFDASFAIDPGNNEVYFCSNRSGSLSDVFKSWWYIPSEKYAPDTVSVVESSGAAADSAITLQTDIIHPGLNRATVYDLQSKRPEGEPGYIYFDHNSSFLNEEAIRALKQWVAQLTGDPRLSVKLSAYADNLGDDSYNMWISERRASRIVDYLIVKGIDTVRLSGKGYGETNPLDPCTQCTDEQNQRNRRVEIVISR